MIDARRIEEAGLNALQTQRQLFYDGWLLRVSPGSAKRARSVNAHFGSTLPLDEKIAHCERVYGERELPALFRITPFVHPADLEGALARRFAVAELSDVAVTMRSTLHFSSAGVDYVLRLERKVMPFLRACQDRY